jgi:hypothetical protein
MGRKESDGKLGRDWSSIITRMLTAIRRHKEGKERTVSLNILRGVIALLIPSSQTSGFKSL